MNISKPRSEIKEVLESISYSGMCRKENFALVMVFNVFFFFALFRVIFIAYCKNLTAKSDDSWHNTLKPSS